jgi:hypothetical protein
VLSQLSPRSWGNYALIRKPNERSYYRNHLILQAYLKEMCNKVSNQYGNLCKERNTCIGERGLIFIPRIYNKLLIVFNSCIRNRQISLYFPNSKIPPFSFDIGNYNDTLNHQIREVEQRRFRPADYFNDIIYK